MEGGAAAEWSKALLTREKINKNHKILASPYSLGYLFKKLLAVVPLRDLLRNFASHIARVWFSKS